MGTTMWGVEGFWGGGGIWLMSDSAHCRGIVMHKARHVYCVLSVLRAVPPFFFSSLSSLEASLFSDVMEEANESLRNGMIYSY